jgi:ABC-type nickel/cobalt efflux system permease component RcnA
MQNPPRYSLMRRLLFPYSGEDPLTAKQGLRVVLTWTLLFPLPITLLVLVITLLENDSANGVIVNVVFAFLSGAFIFGILSLLIVVMSNRAAHIRQAWKARNGQS